MNDQVEYEFLWEYKYRGCSWERYADAEDDSAYKPLSDKHLTESEVYSGNLPYYHPEKHFRKIEDSKRERKSV